MLGSRSNGGRLAQARGVEITMVRLLCSCLEAARAGFSPIQFCPRILQTRTTPSFRPCAQRLPPAMSWFKSVFGFEELPYEATREQFRMEGTQLIVKTTGK